MQLLVIKPNRETTCRDGEMAIGRFPVLLDIMDVTVLGLLSGLVRCVLRAAGFRKTMRDPNKSSSPADGDEYIIEVPAYLDGRIFSGIRLRGGDSFKLKPRIVQGR